MIEIELYVLASAKSKSKYLKWSMELYVVFNYSYRVQVQIPLPVTSKPWSGHNLFTTDGEQSHSPPLGPAILELKDILNTGIYHDTKSKCRSAAYSLPVRLCPDVRLSIIRHPCSRKILGHSAPVVWHRRQIIAPSEQIAIWYCISLTILTIEYRYSWYRVPFRF